MSLKNAKTTADYIQWDEALNLIYKLERDKNYMFAILFACGIFTALRISDLKKIKWCDLLDKDTLQITEQKTGKTRQIKVCSSLKEICKRIFAQLHCQPEIGIISNPATGKPLSIQYLNRKLKEIRVNYKLKIQNISTHSMRKTFGRHVWEQNNHSEKSLLLLSELFCHSSTAITKRYLGIKNEELQAVYDLL